MNEVRLVYASVVNGAEPGYDYLAALLRDANENNARLGITGLLCYARGAFLQALEGESAVVHQLFRKISQDPRHRDCEILFCGDIDTRRFADWSMRLVSVDLPLDLELHRMTGAQAEDFLAECAATERRRASPTRRLPIHAGSDAASGTSTTAPRHG